MKEEPSLFSIVPITQESMELLEEQILYLKEEIEELEKENRKYKILLTISTPLLLLFGFLFFFKLGFITLYFSIYAYFNYHMNQDSKEEKEWQIQFLTKEIEKGKVEIENHKQLEVVEEELNENLEKYLLELKKYFYSLKRKEIKKTLEEFTTTEENSMKRSLKK